jgi:hypothetical protein
MIMLWFCVMDATGQSSDRPGGRTSNLVGARRTYHEFDGALNARPSRLSAALAMDPISSRTLRA